MKQNFRRHRKLGKSILEAKFEAQKIAFAPISFHATKSLRDLGILATINQSENGISSDEISSHLKISQYGVKILLEVGLALDLVNLDNEKKYHLTKIGSFILHDEMTRVNMNFVSDVCYHGSAYLSESIKYEKPAGLKVFGNWETIYQGLSSLPSHVQKSWFEFDHFYSDSAFAGALPIVFADKPQTLFDIGGNTGKWAIQCLNYDSNVKIKIIDLGGQLEKAETALDKVGLASRVEFCELDILRTKSIPGKADVIWMSQFLDCFSKAQITDILNKATLALNESGHIFILEPFFDQQKFPASTFSLNHTSLYFTCMANGNSKMYSLSEMEQCLKNAGLKIEQILNISENDYSLLKCSKKD